MPESSFLALLLVGLLGGTHCVGMCGGIVGALAMGAPARCSLLLAYNAGRILSYAVAGAIVGAIGEASIALAGQLPLRGILYLFANLMLIALGLYLLGVSSALAFTERIGDRLWRKLQPLTRRYLPARSPLQAFPLGLLWGWLPCGLVYSALATALSSGSAAQGAGLMLAFGAGTLPAIIASALGIRALARLNKGALVRSIVGLTIAAIGFTTVYVDWPKVLCLT